MNGVERSAAHGQVEGDFGEKSKHQQPEDILFKVPGVEIPFHDQKCENWESNPSDAGQPVVTGDDGTPEVVAQHEDHCQNVQECGGKP